nr:MAG TPA: hypothetical protein [Caudoviricetes sp.]
MPNNRFYTARAALCAQVATVVAFVTKASFIFAASSKIRVFRLFD